MGLISFKPGQFVFHDKDRYEIVGVFDLKSVRVKNTGSGELKVLPVASLRTTAAEDNTPANSGISTFDHVSDKHWAIAQWRYEVIKPLLKIGRTRHEVLARAKEFKVAEVTIYRWIGKFETTGTISSLVPKYNERGGKNKPRTEEIQENSITLAIEKFHLNAQKFTPKEVHKEVKKLCRSSNVEPPHKNTIINRIKKIRKSESTKAREGNKAARDLYGEKTGHFPDGRYPLDVIQIDHTQVNVVVVDESFREEIDRPWLTVAIDVFSRVVFGFYLSPDHPGYFAVSQCLSNSFLPKDKFLRSVDVEGEWDVWGIPRIIHADNAWEFRGGDLRRACSEYQSTLEWRPVKHPEYGAHIERLCGTLNTALKTLPGATFSNIKEKGEYDSQKKAVMTTLELERWLTNYIVNTYHKERHAGINMAPMKKYEMGIRGDGTMPGTGLPLAIEDEERLRISLYPHVMRTVRNGGIVIDHVHYYHDVLRKWINAKDGKYARLFQINYNPRDMSVIYFYDPELKMYFPIPYRNMARKQLSKWDIQKANEYLKKQGIKDIDEEAIFLAHERGKKIVDDASKKTKEIRKQMEKSNFHQKKHRQEKESVAQAAGRDATTPSPADKAKKSSLDDLFKDVKPFAGVKLVNKKIERSTDGDEG